MYNDKIKYKIAIQQRIENRESKFSNVWFNSYKKKKNIIVKNLAEIYLIYIIFLPCLNLFSERTYA